MKRRDWWERLFLLGILAKGLNGAAEVIGGIILLFAGPASLNTLALALTRNELTEDPDDFIATHLLHITATPLKDRSCSPPSTCGCTAW